MASVLTQVSPWIKKDLTTDPILYQMKEGVDYKLVRLQNVNATEVSIGLFVKMNANTTQVIVNTAAGSEIGIVPATIHNRTLLEAAAGTSWTFAMQFAALAWIDVAILLKPCKCVVIIIAAQAIVPGSRLEMAAAGQMSLLAAALDRGKALAMIATGTGTNRIVAVINP